MREKFSIIKTGLLVMVWVFVGAWSAVAGDLETNILSFPEIAAWKYRPDVAVLSANALISAGEDDACAALEKVAETSTGLSPENWRANKNVCFLCRLIFISTNANQSLRPPMIGAPLLSGYHFNMSDWPDLPFVIVSNMPLSMTSGYVLDGIAERGQDYLAYCKANGMLRKQLFSMPSAVSVSNALDPVFNSPRWQSIPWSAFGQTTLTNLDWEQSSNIVENFVKNGLRQQAANIGKN